MRRLVFLILLMLSACGSGSVDQYSVSFGEFQPFVDEFISMHHDSDDKDKFNRLTITINELSPSVMGDCTIGDGTLTIRINPTYWPNLTHYEKQLLLFHEFGHCILGRPHKNSEGITRRYISVMNKSPLLLTDYVEKRQEYLTELFNP